MTAAEQPVALKRFMVETKLWRTAEFPYGSAVETLTVRGRVAAEDSGQAIGTVWDAGDKEESSGDAEVDAFRERIWAAEDDGWRQMCSSAEEIEP